MSKSEWAYQKVGLSSPGDRSKSSFFFSSTLRNIFNFKTILKKYPISFFESFGHVWIIITSFPPLLPRSSPFSTHPTLKNNKLLSGGGGGARL